MAAIQEGRSPVVSCPDAFSPDARRLRSSKSAVQLRVERPKFETAPMPRLSATGPPPELRRPRSSSALSAAAAAAASDISGRWKTAFDEAQYWAGSLIGRPSESTRHFSIIRHSHALVWYRGPATSVSVSVLSDKPLPSDRKLWLQQRGFSGKTGMAAKALIGSTGDWLDVTPVREARPEHLGQVDERGIQRDLRRFADKMAKGRAGMHLPRETLVVRIPAAVADGYFRLVLCAGKKVLCGSPVFRIASTSSDAAVVRGASLATLPLELSVRVASTVGQQTASKYLGVAGLVAQNRARALLGSKRSRPVLNKASSCKRLGLVGQGWRRPDEPVSISQTIGSDDGPEPPFPIKLEGKPVPAAETEPEPGFPTVKLEGIPLAVRARLRGVFAAWFRILPPNKEDVSSDLCYDWLEAVVTIAPPRDAAPGVAVADVVSVHIARDMDDVDLSSPRSQVLIMCLLRTPPLLAADEMGQHAQDVATTLAILGRGTWSATEGRRSVTEKLTGALMMRFDGLPLHWAGVRSEGAALQDCSFGVGGIWIAR
ncbi:hypothetical protein XA68_16933 [Ophiocordyceps unilateralis]|uniref:Riboflavin kinase n=1 Tax=Ophiocordyceps unilateralis TaxID=268505 RepID=A0A2A9PL15_OPHUN|nr:hypothetical protein XA68_16933 [Ophiocordyceps unilateralis]